MGIEWKFRLGQCVTGANEAMPSLVLARCKMNGDELYKVRSYARRGPWGEKTVRCSTIKDVSPQDPDCGECLLIATGLCPGSLRT